MLTSIKALLASRKGLAFVLVAFLLVVVALLSGKLGVSEGVFETLATALVFSQGVFSGSNAVSHWSPRGSVKAAEKT